jgi:dihydroorotase
MLLKNITIMDKASPYHLLQKDILIRDGKIVSIGDQLPTNDEEVIQGEDLYVSIGWMDIGTTGGEPGLEHRETLASLTSAAAAGGYTCVALFPNNNPATQSKSEVEYIKTKTVNSIVDILPIGALSHSCEGVDISEMVDMHYAGAVAFADGIIPVQNSGLMMRALEYATTFGGLVMNRPYDTKLHKDAQLHEGEISAQLGIVGMPVIAESLMLERDIQLLEYTDSRLHTFAISTSKSVENIKDAKKNKLNITASVAVANLCFTHEVLLDFDTNFKVMPPLRDTENQKSLIKGLKDNVIDCIVSGHLPWDVEEKNKEFTYAQFGIINLQTTFSMLMTYAKGLDIEMIIDKIAVNPRIILAIEVPKIQENEIANLTIFAPSQEWNYSLANNASKSHNSPLIGKTLKGKVIGIINGNKSNFN